MITHTQPRKRRTYTKEFKESALKLADEIGSTKAGSDLGVDPSVRGPARGILPRGQWSCVQLAI